MRYWYYPGCSLHSTALEYDLSTRAVCDALDIELIELDDWNCCGASSVHSLRHHEAAVALPARNVLLAQSEPLDIAIPCAACFYHTASADAHLKTDAGFRQEMEQLTGLPYTGEATPRTLLDVLGRDITPESLSERVARAESIAPLLEDLRPAPYYGCLSVRPPALAGRWDDPENPVVMSRLLEEIGCKPVKWSYTVECCGASLAISRGDIVQHLVGRIIDGAAEAGANCIVTACPLCQTNLDSRQGHPVGAQPIAPLPVFYFTELLAMALGIDGVDRWLRRHLVDPKPVLGLV